MPFVRIAALAAVMAIIAISLTPIGLEPALHRPTMVEQGAVFALFAALVGLAFPNRPLGIAISLVVLVIAIEILQAFTPGRSGSVLHVAIKLVGTSLGIAAGQLLYWCALRFGGRSDRA